MVTDGPHGLRKQADAADHLGVNESIKAICYPTGVGIAASFSRDVAGTLGKTLGRSALNEGVGVVLGPAINIKRSPLCGRNFEYLSEDPYLAGALAVEYINGVQSKNVGVSVKHFAANNQETRRMTISVETDERTLREIYFPAFEMAVKRAQPYTIMCSYNKINGVYSSENDWLLNKVLRDDWGFTGYVVTDWGAVADRVVGLEAGLDLEMPSSGGRNDRKIVEAVKSGKLNEAVLDRACERILEKVYKFAYTSSFARKNDLDADHDLARKLAGECMVLLKNENILPLQKDKKYAFIGKFAKVPRYQGGGSSHINSYKPTGAWDAASDVEKIYADGYDEKDEINQLLIDEAVEAAKSADVAIVFAGLPDNFESEGFDRTHMDMPNCHNALIEAVAAVNPNTVVVLHNGSPVTMPWVNKVKGILEAYLGGEASGEAVYDILFGAVNPSAKLPETFPISLADCPSSKNFPGNQITVEYREGLYVGYRWFDSAKRDVLFPFGHGLSYTEFKYSGLKVSKTHKCKNDLKVSFKLKNVGKFAGAEVVQLYVKDVESTVYRPDKELKAFDKKYLEPGEEVEVTFELDRRAFAFYNVDNHDWTVESGDFEILVGASSRDIRLNATVAVTGDDVTIKDKRAYLQAYFNADVMNVPEEDFENLIGRRVPPANLPENYIFKEDNCFADAENSKWGGRVLKLIKKFVKDDGLGSSDIMVAIVSQTPFRAMANMSNGIMDEKMMQGLIDLMNGDNCKGYKKLLRGAFGIPRRMHLAKKNKL
jgi:Beta-glucosidase-related glycosidases